MSTPRIWKSSNRKEKKHRRNSSFKFAGLLLCSVFRLFAPMASPAQVLTQISDTLYNADGTTASGRIVISWDPFSTADSSTIDGGTISYTIPASGVDAGKVDIYLAPNVGATPSGTSYQTRYYLASGASYTETWVVPAIGPVTIADVRTSTIPTTTTTFNPLTHLYSPSVLQGDLLVGSPTAGYLSRLGIGSNGLCLTSNGTTVGWGSCATGSGITSLNGQLGTTQTLGAISDANVTLGINSSADNHQFTLGWTGQLSLARGGTNAASWTASRCVRVNDAGTALEAAAADCGTGGSTWGSITGTLSNQTDLQSALNGKQDALGFTPEDSSNKDQASGYAGLDGSGKLTASELPNPSTTTLGGVKSLTCSGTDKLSAIGTDGLPVCSTDQVNAGGGGYDNVSGDTGSASKTATEGLKIKGTANQIATVAADGTPDTVTISIPTNPALPGTTTGTFSGNLTGNVSGNATSATALAADPADCSADNFSIGINASGDLSCNTLAYLTGNITLWDGSQAMRSLTASLSGATDPVLTFANNSVSSNVPVTADLVGNVTGNADTATALASDPTDCAANTFAQSIDDGGNLTCSAVSGGSGGDITDNSVDSNDIDETAAYAFSSSSNTFIGASYTSAAADPADAGAVRLGNAEVIGWEAATPGTDLTLSVDSSDALAFSGLDCSSGDQYVTVNASHQFVCGTDNDSGGAPSFGTITSGTNTSASMIVGSGASLRSTAGILGIPNSITAPVTCTVGDVYFDSDAAAGSRFLLCTSTNVFTAMDNPFGTAIDLGSEVSGTLDQSNMDANVVMDNEANSWSTGAQSFASATSLTVPTSAGAGPTTSGQVAYDSTANALEYGDNGTNRTVVNTDEAQTLTTKTISGSSNTLTVLAGSQLSGQTPAANGGTGDDTSSTTGIPRIDSGNWTYAELSGDVTTSGSNVTAIASGVVGSAELDTAHDTITCNFTLYDSTGLADGDDINTISNCSYPGRAITITSVRCEVDAGTTTQVQLQHDDGTPANLLSSTLICSTTAGGAAGTIDTNEDNFASTDTLDFVMTAAGTANRLTMLIQATID